VAAPLLSVRHITPWAAHFVMVWQAIHQASIVTLRALPWSLKSKLRHNCFMDRYHATLRSRGSALSADLGSELASFHSCITDYRISQRHDNNRGSVFDLCLFYFTITTLISESGEWVVRWNSALTKRGRPIEQNPTRTSHLFRFEPTAGIRPSSHPIFA